MNGGGAEPPSSPSNPAKQPFSVWLQTIARYAKATDARGLHELLVRHGCHCTEDSVSDWLAGEAEPSYDKSRDIIKAFYAALPGVDVWEEYRKFVKGEPFLVDPGGENSREPTLEEILRRSGLPPGLLD